MTQLPLWEPDSSWKLPTLANLPSWKGAKRVGFDVETKDTHIKTMGPGVRYPGNFVCGYSFAIEDGPRFYLPVRHSNGENLDAEQVEAYLRAQAAEFDGELVGANLSYDLDWSLNYGIDFKAVKFFRDIQIADPLIYELHDSYSLDKIGQRYGIHGKEEALLREAAATYRVDPKGGMWQLPPKFVGAYAENDVLAPLLISRRQERTIDEQGLWQIYDLESEVLPVLVRMRRRGVRIDERRLEEVETWALAQEAEALARVYDSTGVKITVGDVWKAEALAPALRHIGVSLPVTARGKASIDKNLLGHIDHPVGQDLASARKFNKLRTTFAASVRRYMVNGRIHCSFNQIAVSRNEDTDDIKGGRFGRLSCDNPNLQQQPSRDDFAKFWRSIYVPEEGALWCSNDYSQQEPRWVTHFAAVMDLPMAREAAKRYRDDPNTDNHQMMSDMTGVNRKQAKAIYLGLCYGEGGRKLCQDLGLPTQWLVRPPKGTWGPAVPLDSELGRTYEVNGGYVFEGAGEEGQRILDMFDERAPFIKKLAKECQKVVEKRGFIKTIGGRHCHFPKKPDGTYDWTHKSLNRLIQGSSADQVKRAMVEIDRAGFFLQLQIHDEIANSVKSPEEGKAIAEIMMNVYPAELPFKVDTELGSSWGDSM